MLILTRREQQRIMLGEDIIIQVVSIRGGSVRIGIEAPQDVVIRREEVEAETQSLDTSAESG